MGVDTPVGVWHRLLNQGDRAYFYMLSSGVSRHDVCRIDRS